MRRTAFIVGLLLALAPARAGADEARAADWLGTWETGFDQTITITDAGEDMLAISGEAYWGLGDPEREANGSIHIGEFAATLPVTWIRKKARLSFAVGAEGAVPESVGDHYDCTVWLHLEEGLLQVEDNAMCGGANVTFSGVYRKVE